MSKAVVCFLLLSAVSAWGQGSQLYAVSGSLIGDDSAPLDRLTVVIKRSMGADPDSTAFAGPDGHFEFKRQPEGNAELQVMTSRGDVIARQFIQVPSFAAIEIKLPRQTSVLPGGPVSVYRLQHQTSRKAQSLWNKARKLAGKGKHKEAEGMLVEALKEDPEYADAMEQIGVYALQRGDGPTAVRHLTTAATLDGGNAAFQRNAAIACLVTQKDQDAERYARNALRLEPDSAQAHYVLGLSLFRLQKDMPQVIESLKVAEGSFPRAKAILKQLLR